MDHAKEDDEDRGAGVKRQLEDCQTLAAELGWQVVDIYPDNDASATSGKVREEYQRMIGDIESGRINAVIAWHTDRLYRRLSDLEELAKICDKHSLAVRTCRSGELDMSSPTGRMIARILGSVATYEVEQKADRWKRSVRQRREAGRWWNSANRMFGYTREGELIQEEADALRQVCQLVLSGGTVNGACHWLNDHDFTTTRGNQWMPSSLRATLRSPKIAGLSQLRGEILREGSWEPVIDRATWEQVVAAIRTRNHLAPPPRLSLLGGLLFCGVEDCGRKLVRNVGKDGPIYRCRTELKSNGHVAVSAAGIEDMIESYARERLATDAVRRAIAARLTTAGTAASELAAEIDRLEHEIRELGDALRTAGKRSKLELSAAIDELDAELEQKRTDLSRLQPVVLPPVDEWPDDLRRRKSLIQLVVARAYVFPATKSSPKFDNSRVRIEPT